MRGVRLRCKARLRREAFALALGITAPFVFADAVGADEAPAYHVVLARTGASALLLWNATPFVTSIVAKRTNDRDANDVLERGALRAAAADLPLLGRAKTIDVRVLFDKTGDVSPVYGSATFAGVERYALVRLDGGKARRDTDRWRELRSRDPVPAWISYRVVGSLPPR